MKSLVHTEELCSWSVSLEHAPGEKSLVCSGLKPNRSIHASLPRYFWRQFERAIDLLVHLLLLLFKARLKLKLS